jgi:signal transduction histidine kinase/ActR/RegA family two-component response regulator
VKRLRGPRSLASRFALASAGLAAIAVLLVTVVSSVLSARQQAQAEQSVRVLERHFNAERVGAALEELSNRMVELAASTILATGLVDSAGRETYLVPYLNGVRQVDGVPVRVLFTDFQGQEIASNGAWKATEAQMDWLRNELAAGRRSARIFPDEAGAGPQLVSLELLRYSRTPSPEGAVFYVLGLEDIPLAPGLSLQWGPSPADERAVARPSLPEHYKALGLRVTGEPQVRLDTESPLQLQLVSTLIALAMFLAVLMAGKHLAKRLTRDLSELEAFSRSVVAGSGSGERAPEGTSTEVSSLSASINEMLERLEGQNATLTTEGRKLEALAQALRAADRRKDEFLAMLAHELRNPLAPIATGAELLRLRGTHDPTIGKTADVIGRQARHMRKLVDDLLDVSRVTRGLVTLDCAPVDLRDTLRSAVDQLQPEVDARGHTLDVQLPEHPLVVHGDSARLVQVFGNLLHNACKYTPDGGHIRIVATQSAGGAQVQVQDDGCGIEPEFMQEMFDLFSQSPRLPDRSAGGLGLGLPLVRRLVELHAGRIDAQSAGTHKGATFNVWLPLLPPDALPRAQQPAAANPTSSPARRLMVVDDNVDAAQTLASLLELEGHEVAVAHDAGEALALAAGRTVDAFILDIGLPGMDGIELAAKLRGLPGQATATFIALTGYGQEADRERSRLGGFHHHLVKPVDPAALLHALAAAPQRPPAA